MDRKKIDGIRLIGMLFLQIIGWGVVSGCAEDRRRAEMDGRDMIEVTCCLQIEPLMGEPATRSDNTLIDGEGTTAEETEVNDLTVIQFDGNGDATDESIVIRTFSGKLNLGSLSIGLMQPPSKESQYLYFICNVGDVFANFTGTLGELEEKVLTISREGGLSGGIVMTGTCRSTLVGGTPIMATLTRRFAKIRFTYNTAGLPEGDTFEPVWLQLLSVPKAMMLESVSVTTDMAVGFSDLDPVLENIEKGYVWYIPENKRGKGKNTGSSAANKGEKSVPDGYCTYILLEGTYHQSSDNKEYKVFYRFYPGADAINDFNLEGNHVYNVGLTLKGIGSNDDRVASQTKEELPGANCYMTAPGSTLTFNPHAAAGIDVPSTGWTYAGRMGTKENSNIDHVGLVWQTEPGLIRNIYYLTSSGEIRLATENESGNALIAAYDKNNRILWSWHIWVTDYSVEKADYSMEGTSAEVDNGYVYKFKDYIWMDRGPGALSNVRTNITNLGMTYQWGRKDPFVPANTFTANTLAPMYDANGERVENTAKQFDQAYVNSVGDMFNDVMQNPLTFFTNGGADGKNDCLWYGMVAKGDLWSSTKTFFDPCPAGWCVPPAGARPESNNVSYNTSGNGKGFYITGLEGLFWPYIGYRNISTGAPNAVGGQGIYWTSENGSGRGNNWAKTYGASGTTWDSGSQFSQSRRHSDGMGVRCVKIK